MLTHIRSIRNALFFLVLAMVPVTMDVCAGGGNNNSKNKFVMVTMGLAMLALLCIELIRPRPSAGVRRAA